MVYIYMQHILQCTSLKPGCVAFWNKELEKGIFSYLFKLLLSIFLYYHFFKRLRWGKDHFTKVFYLLFKEKMFKCLKVLKQPTAQ